tara:strand:+ start:493 stop:2898 length:2406 start_codon:yes stop_codon:yes gene_type:complete
MADAIRLHAEFTDDLGTAYKLNIHQNGFVGSSTEFNLGADGFTLRYSGNNEDRMQPIIGSEVTFTLIENVSAHTTFLTALGTSEDADFTVSIFKDPDGANTLFWTGVLLHEQVVLQDEAYPIQNTMTAVDDLGNLKNVLYNNDGTAYTGRDTLAEHLIRCLNKTRALHIYATSDVFLKYANDFKASTFVSANALIELEVNHAAFYNVNEQGFVEFFSAYEVLQNLATTMNARVFFSDGYFWFLPIGAVKNNVILNVHTVTKGSNTTVPTSTISTGTSAVTTRLTVGTDIVKLRGATTTFLPALNKVQRTWRTNNNLPLVGPNTQFLNASGDEVALGTSMTDNSLAYDQGTLLRLAFLYTHSFVGDGTSTGSAEHARLVLKMSIRVGSLYYNNAVTFGPSTMDVGNGQNVYSVDVMQFSSPAWSGSAGHLFIPVTPTPHHLNRNNGLFYNFTNFPTNFVSLAYSGEPFVVNLDALPSSQTGITISVNVEGYDADGNLITDVTGANATAKLQNFEVDLINGGLTNGDRIVYEATTPNDNQETLIQNEVVIGSSTNNDIKNIYENNSAPDQPVNSFVSFGNTSPLSIHKLGVKEVLAGQNFSTRVNRGTVYKDFVSPLNTMLFATRDFLPFETTFIARAVQTEYEAFFLTSSDSNISVPDEQVFDDHTPVEETEPIYDLQNAYDPTDGVIAPNIFQRFLQQPVTAINTQGGRSTALTEVQQAATVNYLGGAGTGTIQLPAVANFDGAIITIVANGTVSSSNIVSIVPASGDTSATINGAASFDLNTAYEAVQLLCSGGNWFVVN